MYFYLCGDWVGLGLTRLSVRLIHIYKRISLCVSLYIYLVSIFVGRLPGKYIHSFIHCV